MATKAGVGFSKKSDSRDASIEAIRLALSRADLDRCDLVLLFASAEHHPEGLRDGIRAIVGPTPRLFGGAAAGAIINDTMGYGGHQVGVAVIASDSVGIELFRATGLPRREYEVGCTLGKLIRIYPSSGESNLLLMYDLIQQSGRGETVMNLPSPLIRGLEECLGQWPHTAGFGIMGDLHFGTGFHFYDDDIGGKLPDSQAAMALLLHGDIRMDSIILHGCRPSSGYFTITKADRQYILELDGQRASDVIREALGHGTDAQWEEWPSFMIFGMNRGEKFGEYREDDYTVRFCTAVDRERGGIAVLADDLLPGTEVQLMRRDMMYDSMEQRVKMLLDRLQSRRPLFALYIDCVGRSGVYSGTDREDAWEVQRLIGDIPLLGMYSGVEIAQVGSDIVQNNYTGVLCLFSESA